LKPSAFEAMGAVMSVFSLSLKIDRSSACKQSAHCAKPSDRPVG
jgi:hypothetical protein